MPRFEKSLDQEQKRWIRALTSFEAQELFFKSVLMRSVSLKEMREDLTMYKKLMGYRERPIYAC